MGYSPSLISHEVINVRGEVLDIVNVVDSQIVGPAKYLKPPLFIFKEMVKNRSRAKQDSGHQPKPNE